MTHTPSRRTVLRRTDAGAAALRAGCAGGGDDDSSAASPGREPARTGDVPIAGGKVLTEEKIVVTQPRKGEFKAFSAVCTHQGCIVSDARDGTIDRARHGSGFAVADGSVVQGPATKPLPGKRITVEGNSIRLA
ncbi:Rieske (2Fe-2S) protein [Streptomyces sp. NPDC085944]|uniref:Rieske (2Fe-2S) protein n=1 Tax=Streptomyces sp. NPDC085944 TaxID=3154962 RepID=UPI003431690F